MYGGKIIADLNAKVGSLAIHHTNGNLFYLVSNSRNESPGHAGVRHWRRVPADSSKRVNIRSVGLNLIKNTEFLGSNWPLYAL